MKRDIEEDLKPGRSLEEQIKRRPVNRDAVDALKTEMLREVEDRKETDA